MDSDRYGDLLGPDHAREWRRLVAHLDAGYRAAEHGTVPLPPSLARPPAPHELPPVAERRWRWPRLRFGRVAQTAGVLVLALIGVSIALAASGVINLGKPAASTPTNPYFPLSGFHRIPKTVKKGLRAEVLVISSSDMTSGALGEEEAAERWPIVKALQQFGTLTGLRPIDRPTITSTFGGRSISDTGASTIGWVHARYSSRYVAFVHRDLLRYDRSREKFVRFQSLSPIERVLYKKYAKIVPRSQASLPLIAVGNYLQVTSQIINWGDFVGPLGPENQPGPPLSFGTIQSALASGKDPAESHLVESVNAETNVMIALICHADGKQPASVCGRPAITAILKHVR